MRGSLSQLWGVVWYELRLQWVRRSLPIMGVCFALILLLFLFLVTGELEQAPEAGEEIKKTAVTFSLILGVTPVSLLLVLLALPPVLAETVARDQQFGLDELRDTLPISPGLYLAGKVGGVWLGVGLMVGMVALLSALFAWVRLGPLHVVPYARIWLTTILPAGLFVSGMSVLLAAAQPSRKRATLVGGMVALYSMVTVVFTVNRVYDWLHAVMPSAWFTVAMRTAFQYMGETVELPAPLLPMADVPMAFVRQTAVATALQLFFAWLLMVGWWRWRRA